MNKIFHDDIFYSSDKYEINNVPNYDLFNKYVFDIFKEVEIIGFTYSIIASKWVVCEYQQSSIEHYLKWRKDWFEDTYLDKTCEDVNDDGIFDSNKKKKEFE